MATDVLPHEITDSVRSFAVEPGFGITPVDGRREEDVNDSSNGHLNLQSNGFKVQKKTVTGIPTNSLIRNIPDAPVPKPLTVHPEEDGSLGTVLGKFVGTFQGTGMNTIFRPRNGFTNPLEDNLLEINLTKETLQFMESSILKDVPNRGFDNQKSVMLRGIPYQQTVSDHLNEKTGTADLVNNAINLHFEQGLFMRVPQTTSPKVDSATICRMGSIPHGTTINAQAIEPAPGELKNGAPVFEPALITPFFIPPPLKVGDEPPKVVAKEKRSFANFASQSQQEDILADGPDVAKQKTDKTLGNNNDEDERRLREPVNITKFVNEKTFTIKSMNDPNLILKAVNDGKKIESHFTFTVSTSHPTLPGGGVANIAFLMAGQKKDIANKKSVPGNANAVTVDCQYWVSTVNHEVVIPKGTYTDAQNDPVFVPQDDKDGVPGPKFKVQLRRTTTKDNTIKVQSTQIQYSQIVMLDFGILRWPHVSVATLVPALPVLVKQDDKALNDVK